MYKIPAITLFLGQKLIFMPECHSTNDQMLLLCQSGSVPEGTLIITDSQTAGRGQRGNSWEAAPGKNLTFTFLIRPVFLPVRKQFFLNMFVSLGICDYLTRITPAKVQIKWPNDLLVNGKKICGILIENQLAGQQLAQSFVGIGLNVNQENFSVPTATSLVLLTGAMFDLNSELADLLSCLERRYLQLREGDYKGLEEDYFSVLFRLDEMHWFISGERRFQGTIRGLDDIGRLQIEESSGINTYDIRQIRYDGY